MKVVLGTSGLAHPGGSESYVLLMAEQLERLGHDVAIRAVDLGAMAEAARERGVTVLGPAEEHGGAPDAVLVQDAPSAYELAERWPGVPQVFRACSDVHDFQLPPEAPGIVACVVALSDRVAARVRATAAQHEVVRLRHPVDVRRFAPLRPIRERPRRALVLGNYLDGERLEALTASWAGGGRRVRAGRRRDGDAVARAGHQRRGHRGRQGAGRDRGDGLRPRGLRVRLRRARRLGHARALPRDGGRQLRGDGDRPRHRRGRARRGARGLRRAHGRRQPRPGGAPPPRGPPRRGARRGVPPARPRRARPSPRRSASWPGSAAASGPPSATR